MKSKIAILCAILLMGAGGRGLAANEFVVGGDFMQPFVLGGGNLTVAYKTEHLVFEYSHGWALDLNRIPDGGALTEEERAQGLSVYIPWSTGFSVGYRITKNLDFKVEFKEHAFRVTHPDSLETRALYNEAGVYARSPMANVPFLPFVLDQEERPGLAESILTDALIGQRFAAYQAVNGRNGLGRGEKLESAEDLIEKHVLAGFAFNATNATLQPRVHYRTRTAGFGFYYSIFFNEEQTGWFLEPSVRFWPSVWTSLKNDRVIFENRFGLIDVHKANDAPFGANITGGYTFKL
jgi:hypothetical protein